MRFRVVWLPMALNELAAAWIQADTASTEGHSQHTLRFDVAFVGGDFLRVHGR
jgi:hypothetical protein